MAINPEDIIDPIRYYKPNDPYYYEVDNLPLEDLLENDRRLLQAITSIVASIPFDLQGGDRFATERWVSEGGTGAWHKRKLENLSDVDAAGATEDQVLTYSTAGVGGWEPQTPVVSLDGLSDTDLTGKETGDLLQYDGTVWNTISRDDLITPTSIIGTGSLHYGNVANHPADTYVFLHLADVNNSSKSRGGFLNVNKMTGMDDPTLPAGLYSVTVHMGMRMINGYIFDGGVNGGYMTMRSTVKSNKTSLMGMTNVFPLSTTNLGPGQSSDTGGGQLYSGQGNRGSITPWGDNGMAPNTDIHPRGLFGVLGADGPTSAKSKFNLVLPNTGGSGGTNHDPMTSTWGPHTFYFKYTGEWDGENTFPTMEFYGDRNSRNSAMANSDDYIRIDFRFGYTVSYLGA